MTVLLPLIFPGGLRSSQAHPSGAQLKILIWEEKSHWKSPNLLSTIETPVLRCCLKLYLPDRASFLSRLEFALLEETTVLLFWKDSLDFWREIPNTFVNCTIDTCGLLYKSKHCNFTFWVHSLEEDIHLFGVYYQTQKPSLLKGSSLDFFIFVTKPRSTSSQAPAIGKPLYGDTFEHSQRSFQLRAYRPDKV